MFAISGWPQAVILWTRQFVHFIGFWFRVAMFDKLHLLFWQKKKTKENFLIFFKKKKAKSNTVYCNLIFKRVQGDRSMVYITENTLSLEITEGKYNALSLYVHINVIIYLPAWNKHINKIIWQKTDFTKIHVLTGLQFIYIYIYH